VASAVKSEGSAAGSPMMESAPAVFVLTPFLPGEAMPCKSTACKSALSR
jgi:hypothetical protein